MMNRCDRVYVHTIIILFLLFTNGNALYIYILYNYVNVDAHNSVTEGNKSHVCAPLSKLNTVYFENKTDIIRFLL